MALKFEDLVTRVLKDAKFRAALEADPAKALQSVDVKPTPELIHSLKSMDWASVHQVNAQYKAAAGIST
jgi:hypothetical protein